MSTLLISHPDCARHDMGAEHPECPQRLEAVFSALKASGLLAQLEQLPALPASPPDLLRAHPAAYVEMLERLGSSGRSHELDYDAIVTPRSWDAILYAAGAGLQALNLVHEGPARRAFCLTRPPGHHAESERAMGFCFFSNIALVAKRALEVHGYERVAIVDFDVHHGNGTEAILHDDPRVLFCSSFQHPHYPNTPFATDQDHIVNLPLAAGTDSKTYRALLEAELWPKLHAFAPELVLVSAGFDAHQDDPLGAICLREADYYWLGEQLKGISDTHAGGKLIALLEGGYNLRALGASVVAFLQAWQ